MRTAWKQRFPNIHLNLTIDLSKYHDSRIDRAFYEDQETTDVAILQTLHDFPYWKEQNRLMYYKPATFDDIYGSEKDLDGAYYPILICKCLNNLFISLRGVLTVAMVQMDLGTSSMTVLS